MKGKKYFNVATGREECEHMADTHTANAEVPVKVKKVYNPATNTWINIFEE